MDRRSLVAATLVAVFSGVLVQAPAVAQNNPIKIGVPTAVQLQVGRDTQEAVQMAIDDINAQGGVLGRKLEMVVADETEKPEAGINAVKKLTAEDKVDVMIGGYTSGVTLAQLPHIVRAKTIYIGVGAASPAVTQRVKKDYDDYKYIFRVGPIHAGHQARQVSGRGTGRARRTGVGGAHRAGWQHDPTGKTLGSRPARPDPTARMADQDGVISDEW